uniref:Uncharacterized protein n=1 Tax=Anguilla anguilla TaxID=7936 RepID=A0A0E9TND3_ANGAN
MSKSMYLSTIEYTSHIQIWIRPQSLRLPSFVPVVPLALCF